MPMDLLSWLLLALFTISTANPFSSNQSQEDALWLLNFKDSIFHDPNNLLLTWKASTHPCSASAAGGGWYGVSCDPLSATVVSLNLTGGGLVGVLLPSIGNLTNLQVLSLNRNSFSGHIPPELGKLKSLQTLKLQGCNFSGSIPNQIRFLSSLRLLNLSYNSLSGSIPSGLIGSGRLSVIDLSNNQLSGDLSVSDNCEFLQCLKLSNNFLVNEIPPEIGKCSNLRTLLLDGNVFQGRIPIQIGKISQLRVLDVSRNSLTDKIPPELANCLKLSVVMLTNLADLGSSFYNVGANGSEGSVLDFSRGEFNAFNGGIPSELLLLPNLQILWAPRANLGGQLPSNWSNLRSCSLRVLNLGSNNITGSVPESLGVICRNLTFLDLSSNGLQGHLPRQLRVPCMLYFNISRNSLSGALPQFENRGGCDFRIADYGRDGTSVLDEEDIQKVYFNIPVWGYQMNVDAAVDCDSALVVAHDFSWNAFAGPLPLFSVGEDFLLTRGRARYKLFFNNNNFNGTFPTDLITNCNDLHSLSLTVSANQINGVLDAKFFGCLRIIDFEAAENQIDGSIPPEIGNLELLQYLDLSSNRLSGSLPYQLGELKNVKQILLGENNLRGKIPAKFGHLTSLETLNLSYNGLTNSIPESLAYATSLEILLLDHNNISGGIPLSLSTLSRLIQLNLSFNNLSGPIPHFQRITDCTTFRGNKFLHSCPDQDSAPPARSPIPPEIQKPQQGRRKLKSFVIAICTSVPIVLCALVVTAFFLIGTKRLRRVASLHRNVVTAFADAHLELNYDNVVRATGNFGIGNLIGTGGFGSTYKAELVPGFLVAVKKLSIGRFQGIQQFDAEIRTLGRIRHKNLVTLFGYYVGEDEMFLVYNFLSGGNLEHFIHQKSGMNKHWPTIHKIAMDIAQALTFLHYSCVPRIVHRDIKPSNILLDEELNAYLSDFGLARLLEVSDTHATTDVAGTFGYVAPEYATTCRVSHKADVYSYGVVLLELMSGKKSLDPSFSECGNGFTVVAWAKLIIEDGRYSEFFSPELWESGPQENLVAMLRLASSCAGETLSVRPSMKQVLEKLKQLHS
ncbi:LRR receptor-like serine/threonine-protein kinase RPK2 [Olea europaea var. sylvestris]|uniref:LRR receptor-like serine/threonine-protein kinase RPK2 n=1 Tax=Olea europaea var. sylvestris TaxID=158386 RepID=UPI000C1CE167|nr:LRR receptor-like serine/threonine-protein kinase RPK2 [Olea europaea var. sylvestris]